MITPRLKPTTCQVLYKLGKTFIAPARSNNGDTSEVLALNYLVLM